MIKKGRFAKMSKKVFGEITLSEAIDRLKKVSNEGLVLVPLPPGHLLDTYNKEFSEAVDVVLNFVDCAYSLICKQ